MERGRQIQVNTLVYIFYIHLFLHLMHIVRHFAKYGYASFLQSSHPLHSLEFLHSLHNLHTSDSIAGHFCKHSSDFLGVLVSIPCCLHFTKHKFFQFSQVEQFPL